MPRSALSVPAELPGAVEVLDGVTDCVILMDRDWRVTFVNAETRRLLGRQATLIGRTLWDIFPLTARAPAREEVERALAAGRGSRFQFYGPDLEAWFDVCVRPVSTGLQLAFHDISAQQRASAELQHLHGEEIEGPDEFAGGSNRELSWLTDQMRTWVEQISRVAHALPPIEAEAPPPPVEWDDRRLAALAQAIYRDRQLRRAHFPQIEFAEPGWDMLLDLFIQAVAGRRVSASSAYIAAQAPGATAARWLRLLIKANLVERIPDPLDKRRQWVELTPAGRSAMVSYLRRLSLARNFH
jgi:PAS domain S-box-containing protein